MRRLHRLPFGGVLAEGIISTARDAAGIAEIAIDGNGQLVRQPEFVELVVEVRGAFDKDVRGANARDQLADQPGGGGTVMPHGEEDHPSIESPEFGESIAHDQSLLVYVSRKQREP